MCEFTGAVIFTQLTSDGSSQNNDPERDTCFRLEAVKKQVKEDLGTDNQDHQVLEFGGILEETLNPRKRASMRTQVC